MAVVSCEHNTFDRLVDLFSEVVHHFCFAGRDACKRVDVPAFPDRMLPNTETQKNFHFDHWIWEKCRNEGRKQTDREEDEEEDKDRGREIKMSYRRP